MRSDWQSATLGDHVDLLTGFPFKSSEYSDSLGDVRLLRGDNIVQGSLRWDGVKKWPKANDFDVREYYLKEGDVVLAMDRPWIEAGLKFAALTDKDVPALLVQRVARLRGTNSLDTRFLRYLIATRAFTEYVLAVQTGTAVPHISAGQIRAFKFKLPPLSEQRAMAEVLSALDNKIAMNQRINETLEAIGRAIFNSWVACGNSDGWRTARLEEVLAELETGSRPKGGVAGFREGVPSVGAESIVGLGKYDFAKTKYVPIPFYEQLSTGKVKSGDVLLYKDGGRPGQYEPHVTIFGNGFPFAKLCINEHVYRLRCNQLYSQFLLYFWLSGELATEEMRQKGTGVAIPGLNSSAVRSLTVMIPPSNMVIEFDRVVSPLINAILNNCNVSATLAAIRDMLLPKLLSGQLRIQQAEEIVKAHA
jgi:type I restriction enzyme, S subunit